jgi:ketosteroid isomerase-like protein
MYRSGAIAGEDLLSVSDLPPPVAAYIAATNSFDLDALMTTFDENALVNDHRSEFRGRDAIRDWAAREIIGDRVTLQVIDATRRGESAAVVALVDGTYDKAGLPDPLALALYFSVDGGRIVQLVIVHNRPS